ncbi:transcription termination factor NusA [Pajaroellobacter abortibovis]|uniref:Transcription termination/antitermination protein NusA n=1 Tax=Pajaroellobacter abortibovis TaxID=1882918 RepID=A0A1L6MZA5_9BACT|nr:transcription termination factor NusA [Pajaroellobacter abortibovis]APS00829.1 transcription termination factor NusA [Pajaroellobacter abortibovis]
MAIYQQSTGKRDLSLVQAIEMVAKDKGIEKSRLIKTVEEAILKAAQNVFGAARELEAHFNEVTGQFDLFQYMTVVEQVEDQDREISFEQAHRCGLEAERGEELGFQIFWHPADARKAAEQDEEFGDILRVKQSRLTFGRIAAQAAKQVLLQRVRDEERDLIYNEFKDRKGELIKGVISRIERCNHVVVDLGRTEGILPFREQVAREIYRPGERMIACVKEIDRDARGPQIILSRTDQKLVEKLFEAEVPEIYEGIVKIISCAREPGSRSKIAVMSRDVDVDPVGACVGMKGARVQAVVQELRGEKIDIVPYDKDPARFVCAAIQPAEVNKVIIDGADGRMELIVPDEKLSLAIGRKGQNVRLASQLTSWKLDIISDSKFKQMEEESVVALQQIEGVTESIARNMYHLGFRTVEEVSEASEQELSAMFMLESGEGELVKRIKASAGIVLERLRQERIQQVAAHGQLTNWQRFLFVRGSGEHAIQALEEAGYRTAEDILREEEYKLAIKTGMGLKKARAIRQAAESFLKSVV